MVGGRNTPPDASPPSMRAGGTAKSARRTGLPIRGALGLDAPHESIEVDHRPAMLGLSDQFGLIPDPGVESDLSTIERRDFHPNAHYCSDRCRRQMTKLNSNPDGRLPGGEHWLNKLLARPFYEGHHRRRRVHPDGPASQMAGAVGRRHLPAGLANKTADNLSLAHCGVAPRDCGPESSTPSIATATATACSWV